MPIPANAQLFDQWLSPRDEFDFYIALTQGPKPGDMLEEGEEVRWFELYLPIEARAMGLHIRMDPGYAPRIERRVIGGHLLIDPGMHDDPAFDAGVLLPIKLFYRTNFYRSRARDRTYVVEVLRQ